MVTKEEKELSVLAIVTGITTGILLVSLSAGVLTFSQLAWLVVFWTKWGFTAFIAGFSFALSLIGVMGIYERFISDPN